MINCAEGIKNNKFTVRQVEQLTAYILKLISQLDTTKYKRKFFFVKAEQKRFIIHIYLLITRPEVSLSSTVPSALL